MCLRFVFLLITRLTAWPRLSRHEETWKGPVVNRVAGLLAAGHGGQVLMSGATCELLAGRAARRDRGSEIWAGTA
jgi:class 3 adenylate cyclase